jgi:hypothetical protein
MALLMGIQIAQDDGKHVWWLILIVNLIELTNA